MLTILLPALLISVLFNLIVFIPAYIYKTDKLTDISYALTFITVAFISLINNQTESITGVILFLMILFWALRLGIYLLIRIRNTGRDKRFDEMRNNLWRFGSFWVLQGLSVFVILVPSVLFLSIGNKSINPASLFGFFIWLLGLIIETLADYQKYVFKNKPENKNKWIETGVWGISRHPNYLGEIMIWIGIYLFVLPVLPLNYQIVGLISPLYITLLLKFISGIPILEKNADKKWGNNQKYLEYKNKTGVLMPKFVWPLFISILIAQSAGIFGSIFTLNSVRTWYLTINKPMWNPPNWIFGPVWTLLFTLMGIASYLVWQKKNQNQNVKPALIIYGIHLVLNTLWSILFFGLGDFGLAFIEIIVLWIFIFITLIKFWKINRLSGLILIPYIFWVSFASFLNFTIWRLNY